MKKAKKITSKVTSNGINLFCDGDMVTFTSVDGEIVTEFKSMIKTTFGVIVVFNEKAPKYAILQKNGKFFSFEKPNGTRKKKFQSYKLLKSGINIQVNSFLSKVFQF